MVEHVGPHLQKQMRNALGLLGAPIREFPLLLTHPHWRSQFVISKILPFFEVANCDFKRISPFSYAAFWATRRRGDLIGDFVGATMMRIPIA